MHHQLSSVQLQIVQRNAFVVVKASGKNILTYLQGQITQDTNRLSPQQALYTAILTPQGKVVTDFYLLQAEPDAVLCICPADTALQLVERLRRFALGYELRIGRLSTWKVISVQGRTASEALKLQDFSIPSQQPLSLASTDGQTYILNMPECEEGGYWLISEHNKLETTDIEQSVERQATLQGIPKFGVDWDQNMFPLNANLMERDGVSFDKGCYVGQEITSRMHWRKGIKKKLYQVQVQASIADLPCPILTTQPVGNLTSLATNPEGKHIGIALLPISTVASNTELKLSDHNSVTVLGICMGESLPIQGNTVKA